ncbi:hypothetical protein GQ600_14465 [Phytophthora cactorum]|nr:hypothetical protein GQ600_14465 [Phytophthora cactorum]
MKKQQILEKKQAEQKNERRNITRKDFSTSKYVNGTPLGDGKALEDAKTPSKSFEHLKQGESGSC